MLGHVSIDLYNCVYIRAPTMVNRLIKERDSHVKQIEESSPTPTSFVGPTKEKKSHANSLLLHCTDVS
jgi:hypothetical protein